MENTGKIWIFYDSVTQAKSQPLTTIQAQAHLMSLGDLDPKKIFLWTPGWENWQSVQSFLASDQKYFDLLPKIPEISQTKKKRVLPQPKDVLDEKTLNRFDDERTIALENATASEDEAFTEIIEETTQSAIRRKNPINKDYYCEEFGIDKVDPHANNKLKINISQKRGIDKREQKRHEFKIEVLLISKNGMSFRSHSENISIGGTLLADELPKDFLGHPFDLILVNKFEKSPNAARLRFQGQVVGDYLNPRRLMFSNIDTEMRARLEKMLKAYSKSLAQERKKSKAS